MTSHEKFVAALAKAYADAWRADIKEHLGQDVVAWDAMGIEHKAAMLRCAEAVCLTILDQLAPISAEMVEAWELATPTVHSGMTDEEFETAAGQANWSAMLYKSALVEGA